METRNIVSLFLKGVKMKIFKWIVYIVGSIAVNVLFNSALYSVLKLGEEKKEAENAELY